MTARRSAAALLVAAVIIWTPTTASAGVPSEGADIEGAVAPRPEAEPDGYREVDGRQEPVYEVLPGDILRISTTVTNTGTIDYWTYGGNFWVDGADVFNTPGVPRTYGFGADATWGSAIGVPPDDPNPDRDHPYTRRLMQLWSTIPPGASSSLSWPLTVDAPPAAGEYVSVTFHWRVGVSDPPLVHESQSARVWLTGDAGGYTDVPSSSPFAADIAWMTSKGITSGYDVGPGLREFRPWSNVTRDAMAAFVHRFAGTPFHSPMGTLPFRDVPRSHDRYLAIDWMAFNRYATGWETPDGSREYRPEAAITRDAMAAFLVRYLRLDASNPPATSPFTDVAPDDAFYAEICALHAAGIATGWQGADRSAQFRPYEPITRDAMAAFLHRASPLRGE
jgi:hypothetical protein